MSSLDSHSIIPDTPSPSGELTPYLQAVSHHYDPNLFRQLGYSLVDILAQYMEGVQQNPGQGPVLPPCEPTQMLEEWPQDFPEESILDGGQGALQIFQQALQQSNHLHHPRYIGHQVSAPLPVAALSDFMSAFLNNGTAIYEMGPASNAMERALIGWMNHLIGYKDGDGLFTSGGSLGNLTALLAARQFKGHPDANIWENGYDISTPPLAVLVSEHSHYCIKRSLQMMGLGAEAAIAVDTNDGYQMTRQGLEQALQHAQAQGKQVFAVVGNGCSTATGTFDDLTMIADFAEAHDLWFHVDGAHGAAALLSETHRSKLAGIHRADSVVWDAHKMMMVPALVTAVLFKNGNHPYENFAQQASYIFLADPRTEWYNSGHRTVECTKSMMAMKLYVALKTCGVQFFRQYIDATFDLTRWFATTLRKRSTFEVALTAETHPSANILCFRYVGEGQLNHDLEALNALQLAIRKAIIESGDFYIVQTLLGEKRYLRVTIINPKTTSDDLMALISTIEKNGKQLMGTLGKQSSLQCPS